MERRVLTEWNDAKIAAQFLKPSGDSHWQRACTPRYINEEFGHLLRRENANRPGARYARSGGWRYHRDDLERVRAIMDAVGCSPMKAAQHLHAMRTMRDRDALEWLLAREITEQAKREHEDQLDIVDQLNKPKRRRRQ